MQRIIITSLCFIATLHAMEQQSNELLIRCAQQKHIAAVNALSNGVIDEFFKPQMLAEHEGNPFVQKPELLNNFFINVRNRFASILEKAVSNTEDSHVMVASNTEDPDNILGFCAFRKREDFIYVNFMAVSQHARGKGIGKALLKAALARYTDISSCQLKTFAYGNQVARTFYEHFGFTNRGLSTLVEGAPNTHIMYQLDIKK